tara:strand:+ start:113 stop:898 length:786 start_codon:yes stop_codon:yes gene_type:complete
MRVFIELAFDGTHYHGWQRQPNSISIQEVLEDTMARMFGAPCPIMGCGRTDAGVHAKYFVAHAELPDDALKLKDSSWGEVTMKLNGMLPEDVAIFGCHDVNLKSHARFDAVDRGYTYYVHNRKDVFLQGRSTRVFGDLDVDAMQMASRHLLGKRDFASFCKAGSGQGTTMCDVREARWEILGPHRWAFHISSDRFLRNMVRAIVGTLLDVGRGKCDADDVPRILEARNRSAAGKSVLGCGLYLTKVTYPKAIFTPLGTKYL